MQGARAELASASTTVDELADRVERVAHRMEQAAEESLAGDLFEVERNLRAARRRLDGVLSRMP
jgi:hypothetical protein